MTIQDVNEEYQEWNKAVEMQKKYQHYKAIIGYDAMEDLRDMFAFMSYYKAKHKYI